MAEERTVAARRTGEGGSESSRTRRWRRRPGDGDRGAGSRERAAAQRTGEGGGGVDPARGPGRTVARRTGEGARRARGRGGGRRRRGSKFGQPGNVVRNLPQKWLSVGGPSGIYRGCISRGGRWRHPPLVMVSRGGL